MNRKKKISFPQYRKYPNGKVYFKITSEDTWEEIHFIGKQCTLHSFKASILPERNFIRDMLYEYETNWVKITESEYEEKKKFNPSTSSG